jgi:hypothetical protein
MKEMTHPPNPGTDLDPPSTYLIRIKGRLEPRWSAWFEGLTVIPEANGDTLLRGPVVDQAALHGLLTRVRDLGLPLLSVDRIDDSSLGTS